MSSEKPENKLCCSSEPMTEGSSSDAADHSMRSDAGRAPSEKAFQLPIDSCCSTQPCSGAEPVQGATGPAPDGAKSVRYRISNMDCPTEERLIRKRVEPMKDVTRLEFNLMSRMLTVHHQLDDPHEISQALISIGMQAEELEDGTTAGGNVVGESSPSGRQKVALAVSGVAAVAAEVLAWTTHTDSSPVVAGLAMVSILAGGIPTLKKGWIALRNLTLNINFLMSLAVIGAMAIGQWPEAAMVVFLFAVAELIESLSLNRARNAVQGLLKLAPDNANVRTAAGWSTVPVQDVRLDDVFLVKPGDRIPLDGVVSAGKSSVNQAPITGESVPVEKHIGDTVFAGTINEQGVLEVKATSDSKHSTLAKIVRVIEETQGNQAPTQRFIDVFARYYTPAVVVLAVLVAVVPPLAFGADFSQWLYKALVMLVIACPCALVISTPVTVVSGLTTATRLGILVKGGQFLESGFRLKALAVDKTGTLTRGRPAVTSVTPLGDVARDDLLLIASSLDAHSAHPLAAAILAAGPASSAYKSVTKFEALGGRGVRGDIDGTTYFLGNKRLMAERGFDFEAGAKVTSSMEEQGETVVLLANTASLLGAIALADEVRVEAAAVIKQLKDLGVATIMLTGDNAAAAHRISRAVGTTSVIAELLPEDKLAEVQKLQSQYGMVGMLGDGVNDAPALAQADIGFAMGAAGSDTAIETADVALMDDDLAKLPAFIELSRATHNILVQNITAALLLKAAFFGLALAGLATLWMAVFADVGASLLVVFNGLRLLRHSSTSMTTADGAGATPKPAPAA
jgi:Cd2+/Zn2+-exporting ATPase